MKIGIISRGSLDNKKLWSGTIFYLSQLIGQSYEVVPITIKDNFIKKVIRKTMHIIFFKNKRTKVTIPFDKFQINKKVQKALKEGVNLYFVMAGSELIASGGISEKCKLIYLSDATYHAMINYYYFDNKHDQRIADDAEQKAIHRADSIIYASEWAKNDAINYYHAEEDKIAVIPFPSYLHDYYKKKINLNKKKLIHLLFVGVEWDRKGTNIAIECVKYLNKSQKKIYFDLTIIGLNKPKDTDYEDYIIFKGRLNKDNLEEYNKFISYYQSSDVFLLPTKAECAGIAFSEACMYGLPIFTHKTGGIGNYVKNKYNGIMLPIGSTGEDFGKEIITMINEEKLQEYSDNSRVYYEQNLSSEAWRKSFEDVVNKLM